MMHHREQPFLRLRLLRLRAVRPALPNRELLAPQAVSFCAEL